MSDGAASRRPIRRASLLFHRRRYRADGRRVHRRSRATSCTSTRRTRTSSSLPTSITSASTSRSRWSGTSSPCSSHTTLLVRWTCQRWKGCSAKASTRSTSTRDSPRKITVTPTSVPILPPHFLPGLARLARLARLAHLTRLNRPHLQAGARPTSGRWACTRCSSFWTWRSSESTP